MSLVLELLRRMNLVPVPLVDTQMQLVRARAILEANSLGVFAALQQQEQGLTVEELCGRIPISPDGAVLLLNALDAAGYVKRRGNRYRNTQWVERWILDREHGLSNYLTLQKNVWKRLEGLGETLRNGKPAVDIHQVGVTVSNEEQEAYTRAMRELARLLLPDFLKRVSLPPQARRLLDIGGAHGEYSRNLVRRYPSLKATVFDLAGPIATAERILQAEGNPEQLELRAGDALKDDFGTGWDVILLANLVHIFNPEQNQLLFRRLHQALTPGGVVIVLDQFTGVSRVRDMATSFISLNLFNIGGRCYPVGEIKSLLTASGFGPATVKPFPPWQPTTLVQAAKVA